MKKFLSLFIVSFLSICAFADDGIFVEGTISKENKTNTVNLMIETSKKIQAIGSYIYFPKGVKPVSIVSTCDVPVGYNYIPADEDGENYLIISYLPQTGDQYIWPTTEPTCVGKITVEIDDDFVPGNYKVVCCRVELSDEAGTINPEDGQGDLIVQKSAVIEPLDANNDIAIIPFEFTGGGNFEEPINAAILMKSESYVKNLDFDFELPAGISVPSIEEDGDVIYAEPELENNKGAVTAEITMNEDGTYHYALSGTSTKYIYAADEMTQFSTLPLMSENPVADGVYTIKIYNISMTTKNDEFEGGNYYASVIVGKPAQEEAILYGHFTSDAASTFTTALKNVAIADVTAATVDDGAKFTDVLVNEKGGNSYYTRTSVNYGTTVLPLDLTTENTDKLYKIESMDSEGIIIEETDVVAANTPCIFKGTINAEGATPTLGVPSEQGLGQTTFKGTYEATSIAEGEGYYIASNGKFYNDGASIRPFRGYFDGAVVGAKSFTVILDDATGLIDITDQFSKEDIYNLQGIRMNNVQKGINIKGGKKVLVK